MNLQSSEDHRAWKGEMFLASVLFFYPTFSQLDGNRLAQSFGAFKGWACSRHISGQEKCCRFPRTDGAWRPELGDTFVPSDWDCEEQNWRGGRHNQSRFEKAAASAAAGQAAAWLELRRVHGVFSVRLPQICTQDGTMLGPPLWSFGGQSREYANAGVRAKTRTMEVGQVSTTLRKERACQPELVRVCSIGPGTLRALQQLLAWELPHGHASPSPPWLRRL